MSSLIIRPVGVLQDPIIILSIYADNTVRTVVHLRWGPELSHVPPFDVGKHRFDQSAVADQSDELSRVLEIDVSDCCQSPALQLEEGLGAGHIEFVGFLPKVVKGFRGLCLQFRIQPAFPLTHLNFPQGIKISDGLLPVRKGMGYSLSSSHTAAAVERIERHSADAGTERFGLLDAQFGQYGIALSLRSALLVPVGLSMSDQMQFHDVQRWLRMRATASCQPAYWRLRQSALLCGVKARSSCHFAAIASSESKTPW